MPRLSPLMGSPVLTHVGKPGSRRLHCSTTTRWPTQPPGGQRPPPRVGPTAETRRLQASLGQARSFQILTTLLQLECQPIPLCPDL